MCGPGRPGRGGRGPGVAHGASPCGLLRLWSRRGQAGGLGPALWFRAQPSRWLHGPRPVSKSVAVWRPAGEAGSGRASAPAALRGRPAAPPAHRRWACPHLSRPRSCPLRHTAGGAPRRPCSRSDGTPGDSGPGGLTPGRAARRRDPKTLGPGAAGGEAQEHLSPANPLPPRVWVHGTGALLGRPQPRKTMSSKATVPLWVAFRVAEKVT